MNCCQYSLWSGICCWSIWRPFNRAVNASWDDLRESIASGQTLNSVLGLLLDLDEGTLSVYINGRRLGTMMSGLSGEYCWVVTMPGHHRIPTTDEEFSIRRASIPEDA